MINVWDIRLEILSYLLTHPKCNEPELRDHLLSLSLFSALKTFKDHLKALENDDLLVKIQNYGKPNVWDISVKGIWLLESRVKVLETELKKTKGILEGFYLLEEKRGKK